MLQFDRVSLSPESEALREQVREFVAAHRDHMPRPNSDFVTGHDAEFSQKLGQQGWIGMTWPAVYGGSDQSNFERLVVTEELLAAGAPVSAHWIADRQSGPLLLRFGSEAQREKYLPGITRGESYFSIGMSEPDTGSDLASVRTTAVAEGDAYRINGTKIWTTDAHRNHYIICLVRTEAPSENRHAGLSQIIVDLRNDGVKVRPIRNMAGGEDFNEVVFEDVLVPKDRIVGEPGNGWQQVTSELAYERSGPERFLSAFRVFVELVRICGDNPSPHQAAAIGRIAAHFMTLRRMSLSVAGMLEQGKDVVVEAALVKELGNNFEKVLPEIARLVVPDLCANDPARHKLFRETFSETLMLSPSFTLRGGTREILRGVIARGLGLR
ncbi:MAG: acyl-CoA dehydrogenase [SAR116 cluster bacterium]|nr:MAG: acyl-CoA dehydrogenase [SAR116 cluster bacterium]HCD26967.1 acyl-CoA dehydrogenase [Gammaproteobacteria bacterium]|tara:strand:+ start:9912 stop:11057 length:1146 start_codon:yes stop_codon:yes gene_type:complete